MTRSQGTVKKIQSVPHPYGSNNKEHWQLGEKHHKTLCLPKFVPWDKKT